MFGQCLWVFNWHWSKIKLRNVLILTISSWDLSTQKNIDIQILLIKATNTALSNMYTIGGKYWPETIDYQLSTCILWSNAFNIGCYKVFHVYTMVLTGIIVVCNMIMSAFSLANLILQFNSLYINVFINRCIIYSGVSVSNLYMVEIYLIKYTLF